MRSDMTDAERAAFHVAAYQHMLSLVRWLRDAGPPGWELGVVNQIAQIVTELDEQQPPAPRFTLLLVAAIDSARDAGVSYDEIMRHTARTFGELHAHAIEAGVETELGIPVSRHRGQS